MQVKSETLGKLVQVGFVAGFRGYKQESQMIFEGIQAVRPENVDVQIGLAVSIANNLNYEQAISILTENVLKREPDNATAKCFLGWVLLRAGRADEGKKQLRNVLESNDEENMALAQSLLDEQIAA